MKFWIAYIISIASLSSQAQVAVEGNNNNKEFTVKNGQDVVIGGKNNDIVIYGSPRSVIITGSNHNICITGLVETLTIKGANADVWVNTLDKVVFSSSSINNNIHWVKAANSRPAPLLNDAGTNNDFHKIAKIKCTGNEIREQNTADESEKENTDNNDSDERTKPVVINTPPVIINPKRNINMQKWKIKKRQPAKQDTLPKRGSAVVHLPG